MVQNTKKVFFSLMVLTLLVSPMQAEAKGDHKLVNPKHLEKEGFGDINHVIKDLSPRQRQDILEKAQEVKGDLQKMPPAEREKLKKQMKAMMKNINVKKVDASKLDTSTLKGQRLKDIRAKIRDYESKHGK